LGGVRLVVSNTPEGNSLPWFFPVSPFSWSYRNPPGTIVFGMLLPDTNELTEALSGLNYTSPSFVVVR
jgi:hypothetical protein